MGGRIGPPVVPMSAIPLNQRMEGERIWTNRLDIPQQHTIQYCGGELYWNELYGEFVGHAE